MLAACAWPGHRPRRGRPEVKFGDPVSVTFWHTQTGVNAEALDEMVRKFNATNGKNITLKSEFQGDYTEVYQKIMASIQAGQPPDVAVAYESMVSEYMKANAVVDLEPYAIKGPLAFSPAEPGRHLPRLHREQPLPRVQQQAALLPLHQDPRRALLQRGPV